MAIVGGRILAVKAEKHKDGALEGLGVNLSIDDVKNEKSRAVIRYTYSVNYSKGLADLSITGELFVEGAEQKEIEEGWKKNKQMPVAITEEIVTSISYTGSAVGTLLAFALNINAPINVQKARLQEPQTSSQSAA